MSSFSGDAFIALLSHTPLQCTKKEDRIFSRASPAAPLYIIDISFQYLEIQSFYARIATGSFTSCPYPAAEYLLNPEPVGMSVRKAEMGIR